MGIFPFLENHLRLEMSRFIDDLLYIFIVRRYFTKIPGEIDRQIKVENLKKFQEADYLFIGSARDYFVSILERYLLSYTFEKSFSNTPINI